MRSTTAANRRNSTLVGSTPFGSEMNSVGFAAVARRLGELARARGRTAPGFRSPPRLPGVNRSLRHESDGSATISVKLRGRPAVAVMADMVEGLIKAVGADGADSVRLRDEAWAAVAGLVETENQTPVSALPISRAA